MTNRTTSGGAADAALRLKSELDEILAMLAERDMDARDVFAQCIQQNDLIRRRVTKIHRAVGLGEPPAYTGRVSIVREVAS